MARIENVNIDGTSYDVGKIATTSAPGVVQVGSGLGVTSAGVLSANVTSVNGNTGAVTINVPTVNNATLTIQKNGTNVQTFTANQSTNATADIVTDELQRKSDTRASMKPSDANYPAKATLHFSTVGAFDTQTQSGGYVDALLLNSWNNDSGGRVNALVATKQNDQKLYHYTGTFNGSTWSGKKEIAYADSLATVATSGSYNDLSNKPTIPTVNNATLTIQKNGTTVNTFTANASSNVTANITVPTQTSDLTNNSGFLTSSTGVTSVNGAHGAVTGIQTTSNLVTSVSSSSTNSQYPSAKLFYDTVGNVESVLQTLNSGTGV